MGVLLGARLTAYASRYAVLKRQGKREMPRWIVLAVPVSGVSDADQEAQRVTEFEGSAEEAEKVLLQAAHTYGHTVRKVRRREIFEASKRSYFIRLQNRVATYGFLIQLAELVHDSDTEDQDSHAA
ncbi:hypothetical protein YW3DRAFT_05714 [Streptomyces sp. MnatMP-M77]|nr:hypothetical protein YW3DRAFT_05714 [Streptomyces sp. MnatMP-M77]